MPPAAIAGFSACGEGPFLTLDAEIIQKEPAFLVPSSLEGCILCVSSKQMLKKGRTAKR